MLINLSETIKEPEKLHSMFDYAQHIFTTLHATIYKMKSSGTPGLMDGDEDVDVTGEEEPLAAANENNFFWRRSKPIH